MNAPPVVRGFHQLKTTWDPEVGEMLCTQRENKPDITPDITYNSHLGVHINIHEITQCITKIQIHNF